MAKPQLEWKAHSYASGIRRSFMSTTKQTDWARHSLYPMNSHEVPVWRANGVEGRTVCNTLHTIRSWGNGAELYRFSF
jgi:hypothetical protein